MKNKTPKSKWAARITSLGIAMLLVFGLGFSVLAEEQTGGEGLPGSSAPEESSSAVLTEESGPDSSVPASASTGARSVSEPDSSVPASTDTGTPPQSEPDSSVPTESASQVDSSAGTAPSAPVDSAPVADAPDAALAYSPFSIPNIAIQDITFVPDPYHVFSLSEALKVRVDFKVTGEATADTDMLRVRLESYAGAAGSPVYFDFSDLASYTISSSSTYIDTAGATLAPDGGGYILTVPVTAGGTANSTGTLEIEVPFNAAGRSAYDGYIIKDTPLATAADADSTKLEKQLLAAGGRDDRTVSAYIYNRNPLVLDVAQRMYVYFGNTNPSYWQLEPNSTVRMEARLPAGAVYVRHDSVSGQTGTGYDSATNTVWWEVPASAWEGINHRWFFLYVKYPSSAFSDPAEAWVEVYAEYTLNGGEQEVKSNRLAAVTLKDSSGGMTEDELTLTSAAILPETATASNLPNGQLTQDYGFRNESDAALDGVVYTLHNNPGGDGSQPGSKAKVFYTQVNVSSIDAGYTLRAEMTARVHGRDGSFLREVTRLTGGAGEGENLYLYWVNDSLYDPTCEYIDEIEFTFGYSGDGGATWQAGLAPQAEVRTHHYFSSFDSGLDHTGQAPTTNGSGGNYDYVEIPIEITLAWDGDGGTAKTASSHVWYTNTRYSDVRIASATTSGSIQAGGDLPVALNINNRNNMGTDGMFGTNLAVVERPAVLVGVPQGYSIDAAKNQSIGLTWAADGSAVPGGDTFTVSGKLFTVNISGADYDFYRVEMPATVNNGDGLPRNNNKNATFTFNLTTPSGAQPSTSASVRLQCIAYDAAHPDNLMTDTLGYFDNTANVLQISGDHPDYIYRYQATLAYTVLSTNALDVSAFVYDAGAGAGYEWKAANSASAATATVSAGQDGKFRIRLTNRGNTAITGLTLYDLVPDLAQTSNFGSGAAIPSEWTATFNSFGLDAALSSSGYTATVTYSAARQDGIDALAGGFGGAWTAALADAKAVRFVLDQAFQPGETIVIEGSIKSPATVPDSDIGKTAINAYGVRGAFSDTGSTALGPYTYEQAFELTDTGGASIAGTIFKDMDANGTYAAGTDAGLYVSGAMVYLYKEDAGGAKIIHDSVEVNADGTYSFTSLNAGTYYVRYALGSGTVPNYSAASTYYTTTLDSDNDLQVVLATGTVATAKNIGIGRTGSLTLAYKFGSTTIASDTPSAHTGVTDFTGGHAYDETVRTSVDYNSLTYVPADLDNRTGVLTWDDPVVVVSIPVLQSTYSITYTLGGGSATGNPASYSPSDDLPLTLNDPVRSGYQFLGWTGSGITGDPVKGHSIPAGTTGNLTFTANWTSYHTLSFVLNGSAGFPAVPASIASVEVEYGSPIKDATGYITPAREGWRFDGWYMDSGLTTPVEDSKMPAAAQTIYAKWTQLAYTLTFDTQGGSAAPAAQSLKFKDKAARPAPPAKTGNSFTGWFDAPTGGTEWSFDTSTMPSKDMTLYAQYLTIKYTVTFKYGGANIADRTISLDYGEKIAKPNDPAWAGHSFHGWMDENGKAWNFATGTMPAGDLTLTAVWNELTYTVRFVDWDGTLLESKTVRWNNSATPPATGPLRTGYSFTGWSGNYSNVTRDETVTATYVENPASSSAAESAPTSGSSSAPPPVSSGAAGSSSSAPGGVVTPGESEPQTVAAPPDPADGGAGGTTGGEDDTIADGPIASNEERMAAQSGNPFADIAGGNVPLGGFGQSSAWSLLNLFMALGSFAMAFYLLISSLRRRKLEYADEAGESEYRKSGKRFLNPLRILSILASVITIVLFLLLDNMSDPMVWVNQWTLLLLTSFVVSVLFNVLQVIRSRRAHAEESDEVMM